MSGPCVTVVDDDPGVRQLLDDILQRDGARVFLAGDGEAGLNIVRREPVDALFVDLRLPGQDGMSVIQEARRFKPQLPCVVLTGHASFESLVDALRLGACDYVTKPFTAKSIGYALARCAANNQQARQGAEGVKNPVAGLTSEREFIAASSTLRNIVEMASRVAYSDLPLFIQGETGVGKEMLARLVHRLSQHSNGPFIRVSCEAMHADQIEPLLFGEEAIASGGEARPGMLEQASGGTLYLHDVCGLPTWLQGKLAESFQRGWLHRVRGATPIPLRTRIIGGTSLNLKAALDAGKLLPALYYFLNVVPIAIPPLRTRKDDIRALVTHFSQRNFKCAEPRGSSPQIAFSPEAMDCLLNYDWPGNVRDLANVVSRTLAFAQGEMVQLDDVAGLCLSNQCPDDQRESFTVPATGNLKKIELQIILEVIKRCQGNKAAAARSLGLHRKTLYRLLDSHGVK